jgi:hypothetical protein
MLRGAMLAISITTTIFLTACAAAPERRPDYASLPPLDSGLSRAYITAGTMSGIKLWSVHQVGPVYINSQLVGNTAKNEYFAVDLLPGTYEASCSPEQPDKNFTEKLSLKFEAGQTRYLACDMAQKGAGMYFGLIGALASTYLTETHLNDQPVDPKIRLVSYKKLDSVPATLSSANPVLH